MSAEEGVGVGSGQHEAVDPRVQAVAAYLDADAMRSFDEFLTEWQQWVSDNTPPNGWGKIDPDAHARNCADDEFQRLAPRRLRALKRASHIAELFAAPTEPPGGWQQEQVEAKAALLERLLRSVPLHRLDPRIRDEIRAALTSGERALASPPVASEEQVEAADRIAKDVADRCHGNRKPGRAAQRYAIIWQAARLGALAALQEANR